jgi:hypothetical protein
MGHLYRSFKMSYAEAKQIALLRQELRACWQCGDFAGATVALAQLSTRAGNDADLAGEVKRWAFRLDSPQAA